MASALALKVHPEELAELPMPRPRIEVFVAEPRVEGVHIRFGAVARGGLRNDLYSAVRTLCIDVLAVCGPEVTADEAIARWEEANRPRLMRAAATLEETAETANHSLATLSVAVRQINGLVSHSAPIPT